MKWGGHWHIKLLGWEWAEDCKEGQRVRENPEVVTYKPLRYVVWVEGSQLNGGGKNLLGRGNTIKGGSEAWKIFICKKLIESHMVWVSVKWKRWLGFRLRCVCGSCVKDPKIYCEVNWKVLKGSEQESLWQISVYEHDWLLCGTWPVRSLILHWTKWELIVAWTSTVTLEQGECMDLSCLGAHTFRTRRWRRKWQELLRFLLQQLTRWMWMSFAPSEESDICWAFDLKNVVILDYITFIVKNLKIIGII